MLSKDLGAELNASLAAPWPPDLLGDHLESFAEAMADQPLGWGPWFFILCQDGLRTVVGNGGFMGSAAEDGFVSIGFEVQPDHRQDGVATEALSALIPWAFDHAEVGFVDAFTEVSNTGAVRTLGKLNFQPEGEVDEGLQRYILTRTDLPD